MILRRLGNKQAIAKKILPYFPPHRIYIEPFFGAGGMFFNKPKAKYNIVNDLDSDVFNLFQVVMNQKEELFEMYKKIPYHSDLLNYWKEHKEVDKLLRAIRFIFISNFTLLGTGSHLSFGARSFGKMNNSDFNALLDETLYLITDVQFLNCDFIKFFKSIQIRSAHDNHFIYADPPYINTNDNYSNSFTPDDSIDLFNILQETGCKWAMSEFDNPFIIEQANQRDLNIHIIGERQNLNNRRTEILITNYQHQKTLFE